MRHYDTPYLRTDYKVRLHNPYYKKHKYSRSQRSIKLQATGNLAGNTTVQNISNAESERCHKGLSQAATQGVLRKDSKGRQKVRHTQRTAWNMAKMAENNNKKAKLSQIEQYYST